MADLINICEKENLTKCYNALSKFNKYELNQKQIIEFRQLLKAIIRRTKRFISTLTLEKKEIAINMKAKCSMFLKLVKNDKETFEIAKELDNIWNVIKHLHNDNDEKNAYEIEQKIRDVEKKKIWFQENGDEVSFTKMNEALETLNIINGDQENDHKLAHLIYITFEKIQEQNPNLRLKRKLYIFDEGKECCVAFYTEEDAQKTYYVDEYGNFYFNESNFLEAMRKLRGHFDFSTPEGRLYNVELLYDNDFLNMLIPSFESAQEDSAFVNFVEHYKNAENEAIKILRNVKIFFQVFTILNPLSKNIKEITLNNDGVRIWVDLINVFDINSESVFDQLNSLLSWVNFIKDSSMNVIWLQTMLQKMLRKMIGENLIVAFKNNQISSYKRDMKNRFLLEKYAYDAHYYAEKLLRCLHGTNILKMPIQLSEFKYIVFWIHFKCKGNQEKDKKIFGYNSFKNIEQDFCRLMATVANCAKSDKHQFQNFYSAMYHFSAHYEEIRMSIEECDEFKKDFQCSQNLPKLDVSTEQECATIYLKYLPDFIFEDVEGAVVKTAKNKVMYQKFLIRGVKVQHDGRSTILSMYSSGKSDVAKEKKRTYSTAQDSGVGSSRASEFGSTLTLDTDLESEMTFEYDTVFESYISDEKQEDASDCT